MKFKTSLLPLLTVLPLGLGRPHRVKRQSSSNQLAQAYVNITTVLEEPAMEQFRNTVIKNGWAESMRTDDIGMCGGIADASGGFTQSQIFNVISDLNGEDLTQMTVPDPVSQGEGYARLYWDLCSRGETVGVIPQARFECRFWYTISQLSDGSRPAINKRIQMTSKGFKPLVFQRGWTDGSTFTDVKCGKRGEPVPYTGQQVKSTDAAVYQFTITGGEELDQAGLCGALPAENEQAGARYEYNTTRKFVQGETFRLPTRPDAQGTALLYYGDCKQMGTKFQATHKCEFQYIANQQQGQPFPFASQLVQVNSATDVQLGQVEGQTSVDIKPVQCQQLQQPVEADEKPESKQPPPREDEER